MQFSTDGMNNGNSFTSPAAQAGTGGFFLAVLTLLLLLSGCDLLERDEPDEVLTYDFRESAGDWEAFFTGYHLGWDDKMELAHGYRSLPKPLDSSDHGLFISALNQSDDVKMLFRRQVDGLEPNTTYDVGFTVRFATDVPSGCAGIGGAPGEAVKVIADASSVRPEPVVGKDDEDYYLLNTQYEQDPQQWYQRAIMGDIANSRTCEEGYQYEIKEVDSRPNQATMTTDGQGRAWLLFGTRSGFEGRSELFYTYLEARFRK